MNPNLEYYQRMAIELGRTAEAADEVPVGALLVHEDLVIGRGYNQRETLGRTVAHAEIMALEDYSTQSGEWRLPIGSTLFSTTEPCLMCTGALLWARVGRIYFGCGDPKNAGLMRLLPGIESGIYDHRFDQVQGGLLEAECAALLKDFFRKKRSN